MLCHKWSLFLFGLVVWVVVVQGSCLLRERSEFKKYAPISAQTNTINVGEHSSFVVKMRPELPSPKYFVSAGVFQAHSTGVTMIVSRKQKATQTSSARFIRCSAILWWTKGTQYEHIASYHLSQPNTTCEYIPEVAFHQLPRSILSGFGIKYPDDHWYLCWVW